MTDDRRGNLSEYSCCTGETDTYSIVVCIQYKSPSESPCAESRNGQSRIFAAATWKLHALGRVALGCYRATKTCLYVANARPRRGV